MKELARNDRIKTLGGFGSKRTKIKPSGKVYDRKKEKTNG